MGMTMEEQRGSVPAPRFGHTTTLVSDSRVLLFGGATGDSGRYTITADAYSLDVTTITWTKISAEGTVPSARAAHAAACVDQLQLVVYGGATGGGSLSSDELFLLDIRDQERSQWMAVPVFGPTPGRRYGHSMVFNKPLLIVFGGNTGQQNECDIWVLDVEQSPFKWSEVSVMHARAPVPRVYHSAEVCRKGPAAGMMVVFGGRTADNKSLKDTWGIRQHRDGRWDWVEAPTKRGKESEARFQHSCLCWGSKLLIVGGRGSDVNQPLPTALYDTETCEWREVASVNRFRHSVWGVGSLMFSYGGFDHQSPSAPTNDLQLMDIERELSMPAGSGGGGIPAQPSSTGGNAFAPGGRQAATSSTQPQQARGGQVVRPATPPRGSMQSQTNLAQQSAFLATDNDVKIAPQVVVSLEKDFTHLVRKIAIENLEDEGRKITPSNALAGVAVDRAANLGVAALVIDSLCQPNSWRPDSDPNRFLLQTHEVAQLCDQFHEIIKQEEMVLRLRAPIKVFGDIHGQFVDLMRLFARYQAPTDGENGDIGSMDYLFLGDLVDRGSFSLETVCLLFALKIKYPKQIHMIRGNHEDPAINSIYGFKDECRRRLGEEPDDPNSCWSKFNSCFEWLPMCAVIEDKVMCIHGGIGGSLNSLAEISALPRPLEVAQIPQNPYEQRITDMLWSDPSDSDAIRGVTFNETRDPEGTGRIFKFGPDRVEEFLEKNPPLSMIIRAHECVMDGFERFANGRLITLFSATDYCGHHKNAGALLFVRRDLTIVPKLIYPVERSLNSWDNSVTQQRPPTPPRAVPRARRMDGGMDGNDW